MSTLAILIPYASDLNGRVDPVVGDIWRLCSGFYNVFPSSMYKDRNNKKDLVISSHSIRIKSKNKYMEHDKPCQHG